MKRSEVWRTQFPGTRGHVQGGVRPAVIVQDDRFVLPTVLVVPFTGQQRATRFPGTLLVQPDGANGLTVPSVALVFQTTAMDRTDCLQHLGVLDAQTLDQILDLLDRLTGR
jgi:mRNA-degrading endonuclease toxin of MazEF toxin-antitoxin module